MRVVRIISQKIGWSAIEVIFLLGCFFSACMMIYRCFYGTEFTDEAFYVSDALAVMHGNIPFAYNSLLYSGASFISMFFYKIYELFVPDLTGVFLYSRLAYTFFRLVVIITVYALLKNKISRKWRLLIAGVLIPWFPGGIPNFSYNTISFYLILYAGIWLYVLQGKMGRRASLERFGVGVVSAFSVFSHPVHAISVLVFIALNFSNSGKGQKLKNTACYCAGGVFVIGVVFISIIYKVKPERLFYGIETMLTCGQDMIHSTVMQRIKEVISNGLNIWLLLIAVTLGLFAFSINYVYEDEKSLSRETAYLFAVSCSALVALRYAFKFLRLENMGYVCAGIFVLLLLDKGVRAQRSIAWYLGLPIMLFILFMTFWSLTGSSRFIHCVPLFIVLAFAASENGSQLVERTAIIAFVVLIAMQGYMDFKNIYRDASFRNLDTVVSEGVYKGIRTTATRARDIVEFEKYLNESISIDEKVSFRDNVPVAYLMRNRNICDIKTWDEMQWSYGCDNPTGMFRYYKNRGTIPDVICYVDFKRDESMSIENSSDLFQFNEFVKSYYNLSDDSFENETFRVLIYRYNGTFNYNFDALIESVR